MEGYVLLVLFVVPVDYLSVVQYSNASSAEHVQVIVMRWDPQEERIAKLNDSSEVCYTADKYLTQAHSSEV